MHRIFNESDIKKELLEIEFGEKLNQLLNLEMSFNIKDDLNQLLLKVQNNSTEASSLSDSSQISLISIKESRKETYELLSFLIKDRTYEDTQSLLSKVEHRTALLEAKKLKKDLFDNRDSSSMFKEEIDSLIKIIDEKIASLDVFADNSFYKEKINMLLDKDETKVEENEIETPVFQPIEEEVEKSILETEEVNIKKPDTEKENVDQLLNHISQNIKNLKSEYKENIKEEETYPFSNKEMDNSEIIVTNQKEIDTEFNPFSETSYDSISSRGSYVSPLTRDEVDVFIKRIDDKLDELKNEEEKMSVTTFDIPKNE